MEWEYRITAADGGDPIPVIEAMLKSYKEIRPCTVFVDSGHAGHVEFGTEPADPSPKYKGKEISPVKQSFRDWAAYKFGLTDPKRIAEVGDRIYHSIMEHGMLPYPYLRPSAYDVLAELQNLDKPIADEPHVKGLVWEICEEIAERSKEILQLNDNVYTEELMNSLKVMEPGDVPASSSIAPPTGKVSKDVWESSDLHMDGQRKPDPRRYRRR